MSNLIAILKNVAASLLIYNIICNKYLSFFVMFLLISPSMLRYLIVEIRSLLMITPTPISLLVSLIYDGQHVNIYIYQCSIASAV